MTRQTDPNDLVRNALLRARNLAEHASNPDNLAAVHPVEWRSLVVDISEALGVTPPEEPTDARGRRPMWGTELIVSQLRQRADEIEKASTPEKRIYGLPLSSIR